jgi:hypothetical protein
MIDFDPALLDGDDSWRLVLGAYQAGHSQRIEQNPEADGWLPRLRAVAGIEGEALSRAHGRLIALGLLKFELAGRDAGMLYQVSPLGKRTLEQNGDSFEEADESAESDAAEELAPHAEADPLSGAA